MTTWVTANIGERQALMRARGAARPRPAPLGFDGDPTGPLRGERPPLVIELVVRDHHDAAGGAGPEDTAVRDDGARGAAQDEAGAGRQPAQERGGSGGHRGEDTAHREARGLPRAGSFHRVW